MGSKVGVWMIGLARLNALNSRGYSAELVLRAGGCSIPLRIPQRIALGFGQKEGDR